jgi:integrase
MTQRVTDKRARGLTDKVVRELVPPPKGNRITYDKGHANAVAGFGVRVTAGGARAFIVNYRRRSDGLERRTTIGAFPDWSVSAAREEAKRLKRLIDGGADPVGEQREQREAPTVADLCIRFLEEHVVKQRPHTQRDYGAIVRNDIEPTLGRLKVAAVEYFHIERLHARITKRAPVRANRMHAVATTMFNLAVRWKMRTDNPCKGIKRNKEHGRRRYLKSDELLRLTKALADDPNQSAADVFRLLLLTGARKSEVLGAQWNQFDLVAATWTKPNTLTKDNREHTVPLSAPARALLGRLQERIGDSPWVFPGRDGRGREDTKYAWSRICRAAGITGLRIHDLRHSFASQLVSGGASLPLIGSLLGHSTPATTHRYSHLFDEPQRAAVERVGAIVSGEPSAEVVPLPTKGAQHR